MKIVQVNTSDIQGGAARAAYRLHRGLITLGHASDLISVHKQSKDETVLQIQPDSAPDPTVQQLSSIQNRYINANRTAVSNTSFSLPYPGFDLTQLSLVQSADVINLHWIAYCQSPITLKQLSALNKPIVWTMHDMWAFTGGCHYSAGCQRYQKDCLPCPQLNHDPYNLPAAVLSDRLAFADRNWVIVTPSQWLADCARQSQLFKHNRIEVIPYSLETEVFVPLPKAAAKQQLGIAPDTLTILAGADNGNEQRKGFAQLLRALKICLADPQFAKLAQQQKIALLCFGISHADLEDLPLPVHALGRVESDERLSQIYSAADLFVLPSLEDNFPNTMLEAMSCGTPVVAFEIGGIPDVVKNGVTGQVVPPFNVEQLAAAILHSLFSAEQRQQMSQACRGYMQASHAITIQAERYLSLYQKLVHMKPRASRQVAFTSEETRKQLQPQPLPQQTSLGAHFQQIFHAVTLQAVWTELQQSQAQQHHQSEQQPELQTLRTQLQQTQKKLEKLQTRSQQLQIQLEQTQSQLEQAQAEITAMKTSKFWKLRFLWFKLKRTVGLGQNE